MVEPTTATVVTKWVLPSAITAIKSRKEILAFLTKTLSPKMRKVVITGHAGAGKSVLADYITEKAYKRDYQPPKYSHALEASFVLSASRYFGVFTVPGQVSKNRLIAFDKVANWIFPPNGIIHVVSDGFISIRDETSMRKLIEKDGLDTIDKFREAHRKSELKDLEFTCGEIRRIFVRKRKPLWLILAVNKADLFASDFDKVKTMYAPGGSSEAVKMLDDLQGELGRYNFRWTSLPVCGWLEKFEWNRQTVNTTLNQLDRDKYIANLISEIGDLYASFK